MLLMWLIFSLLLVVALLIIMFILASKSFFADAFLASSFECGFSSYFYSRFSFSIHYFMIGLIFLFLDLELCFLMPFLSDYSSSVKMTVFLVMIVIFLFLGLLAEWVNKKIEWIC